MPAIPYPCTRCGKLRCDGAGQLCSECRDDDERPTRPAPSDPGMCPYFLGIGTCVTGCQTEPSCMTNRPSNGWPSEHPSDCLCDEHSDDPDDTREQWEREADYWDAVEATADS